MHAQEFQMGREQQMQNARAMGMFPVQHSKSSGTLHQQLQLAAARQHAVQMANLNGQRTATAVLVPHSMANIGVGVAMQSSQMPLVNSPSSGNILHVTVYIYLSAK